MKIHLRFGMHRDVELIHSIKRLLDGLVIPANILAHQTNSTSVFVTSLSDKPYVIDPMTFIFQNTKSAHLNDAGDIRPSVQKMCDAFHSSLANAILKLPRNGVLRPADFPVVSEFCRGVLEFQLRCVEKASSSSGASKYLKRYAKTQATLPRSVIPPYFRFTRCADEWYRLSLDCARETKKQAGDVEVSPVICCGIGALTADDVKTVVDDFAEFKRVFVWIDDYRETSVKSVEIRCVRSLISQLRKTGVAVETLYGGYLMILSHFDDLSALSHGILYTQHKATTTVPGSGGAPERYYIPEFHEFRSLSQTDLILHKHPELMCECPVCREHLAGNADNIIRFSDRPELLRRHFLEVRRAEADAIRTTTAGEVVAKLSATVTKYGDSIRQLPNPDAIVREGPMQGLEYLSEWSEAFRKTRP